MDISRKLNSEFCFLQSEMFSQFAFERKRVVSLGFGLWSSVFAGLFCLINTVHGQNRTFLTTILDNLSPKT